MKTLRPRSALVVGASRGIGLGLAAALLARGWRVTATQRTLAPGLAALRCEALAVETADIDDDASVAVLHARTAGARFDLVFVVAGVASHGDVPLHAVPRAAAAQLYLANAVSPVRFAETFADRVAPGGLVAFMSSILGSVALNETAGWEAYRASKAALNTNARSFAARHRGDPFGVLLVHPGWVRTDMGGPDGEIDVATSAEGIATVVECRLGTSGIAYLDHTGQTLPW